MGLALSLVTPELLREICPSLPQADAVTHSTALATALDKAGIHSPLEIAMLLAQIAHETGSFRYMEEIASGKAYDGRIDLGNIHPGDGPR